MRHILQLLALVLCVSAAHAAEEGYASRPARGLAIYKQHEFASDNTAVLIEYKAFQAHDRVSYLITASGARLTIPMRSAGLLLLPYPGKGEATPQEALAVLEYARLRYPKYNAHILPLIASWKKEAARPASEIQSEVATREKNKETGLAFVAWLRSLVPSQPPPKIPESPLKSAELGATSRKKETPPRDGAADPTDFKSNLETIKEYFGTVKKMEEQ